MDLNTVFNFIDPNFETKVRCSCTEDDYHPLENLVARDRQKCNLGFMAYNVVKPPIDLEFNLVCCIELVSIKIWPKINSLKSTGFEIHIKSSDLQSDYRKIGSFFNLKTNGIQFVRPNDNDCSCDEGNEMNFTISQFYHSVQNQLRKVKNVKIIIKQTERCVPVIKRLEIWGKISKFATDAQKLNIQRILIGLKQGETQSISSNAEQIGNSSSDDNEAESTSSIPEAFLDAITYEIMALPIVLPSGKTIDNSTLAKHNEQQEKWGRAPSDPFSGQMFTDARKPVLNVNLKVQIDAFLLKHSSSADLSMVPRTVGTIKKRKMDKFNGEHSRSISKSVNSEVSNSNKRKLDEPCYASSQNAASSSTSTASKSLDDVIRGALNGRRYTTLPKDNDGSIPQCFQCSEQQTNCVTAFYQIALCSHFICRNCLVDKNIKKCKCGKTFGNTDVNKYHAKMSL